MRLAARIDGWVRRGSAKLTLDRAAYFSHPDWVVNSGRFPPPDLWHPRIETHELLRKPFTVGALASSVSAALARVPNEPPRSSKAAAKG